MIDMRKIKNNILRIFASVFVLLMLAAAVCAYPSAKNYTYDGTGTLTESELSQIASTTSALSEKKGARIAVCVVNSVIQVGAENSGGNLETVVKDYARAVFKEWNVGNGVLLLVSKDDGVYWAVQSNSLTDTLTDNKLREILGANLDSGFAEGGSLSESIMATVKALDELLTSSLPDVAEEKSLFSKIFGVILKIIIAVAILLIAGYVVLVILERRNLEKRRRYEEARRRAMAARRNGTYRGSRPPRGQDGMRQRHGTSFEYSSVYDPASGTAGSLPAGVDSSDAVNNPSVRRNPVSGSSGAYSDGGNYAPGTHKGAAAPNKNGSQNPMDGRTVAFPAVRRPGGRN